MQAMYQQIQDDFQADTQKLEELHKSIEQRKSVSSFYAMMSDKMANFSRNQQLWMEGQIWSLYMQLEQTQSSQEAMTMPTFQPQAPLIQTVPTPSLTYPTNISPPPPQLEKATLPSQVTMPNEEANSFGTVSSCIVQSFATINAE